MVGDGKGTRGEGEGAMVEHSLGVVGGLGVSLNAKVSEHCITFPAAEETDGIGVDVGTEEGGGSTRTEGPGREEEGIDASGVGEISSTVAEGVGDMLGLDGVPASVERVEVLVKRRVGRSIGPLEALGDPAESFDWAEERMGVGTVAHLFPADSILLVSEGQRGHGDGVESFVVIQRSCRAGVGAAMDGEGDVAEEEGLGPGIRIGGFQVLGGPEEPVEGDNDEVDGVSVEGSIGRVVEVEDLEEMV